MKSGVRICTRFAIMLVALLTPVIVFAQPGPPPPPEGIPFDLVSGVILAGAALYNGTRYLRKEAAV